MSFKQANLVKSMQGVLSLRTDDRVYGEFEF